MKKVAKRRMFCHLQKSLLPSRLTHKKLKKKKRIILYASINCGSNYRIIHDPFFWWISSFSACSVAYICCCVRFGSMLVLSRIKLADKFRYVTYDNPINYRHTNYLFSFRLSFSNSISIGCSHPGAEYNAILYFSTEKSH